MNNAETAVQTTTPEKYKPTTTDEKNIAALGFKIIKATIKTAIMYMELCGVIRERGVAPKTVSKVLLPLGFHKSRISEINTVANMPEDKWREVKALQIGFKNAIDIARGTDIEIATCKALNVPAGTIGDELELSTDEATATSHTTGTHSTAQMGSTGVLKKTLKESLEKCIGQAAGIDGFRKMEVKNPVLGLTIRIWRSKIQRKQATPKTPPPTPEITPA